ncbi:MAG: GNAT family N-acetyltransferase [Nitrososphaeraceae archaeon]|nr:GNAT family N-acetyltransferase [Nitrososphaeraceae archaeon]MBV9669112.1 GNAT family N-acetyltransferase [Nitrososphaeraceae archaeon]
MKIRHAAKSDKEEVLRFCVNTFEWGDYIDQAWDFWYSDRNGVLLVAEDDEEYNMQSKKQTSLIAVSHASLCPNNKNVWLEGIRVHPNFRRRSIATELLKTMTLYGKEQGAKEAYAMVAANNIASQLMMESNGFAVISKWSYYSINKIPRADKVKLRSKVATFEDTETVWNYLRRSDVYKSSGKTYVNSWRWYSLDLSVLEDFIKHEKVLVIGNDPIEGLGIINRENNNDDNDNTFQIVYLDALNMKSLEDLIRFALKLIHLEDATYDRIQIYSPQTTNVSTIMQQVGSERSEEFLLYKRILQ